MYPPLSSGFVYALGRFAKVAADPSTARSTGPWLARSKSTGFSLAPVTPIADGEAEACGRRVRRCEARKKAVAETDIGTIMYALFVAQILQCRRGWRVEIEISTVYFPPEWGYWWERECIQPRLGTREQDKTHWQRRKEMKWDEMKNIENRCRFEDVSGTICLTTISLRGPRRNLVRGLALFFNEVVVSQTNLLSPQIHHRHGFHKITSPPRQSGLPHQLLSCQIHYQLRLQ